MSRSMLPWLGWRQLLQGIGHYQAAKALTNEVEPENVSRGLWAEIDEIFRLTWKDL